MGAVPVLCRAPEPPLLASLRRLSHRLEIVVQPVNNFLEIPLPRFIGFKRNVSHCVCPLDGGRHITKRSVNPLPSGMGI